MSLHNIENSLEICSDIAESHTIWNSNLLSKMSAGHYSQEQLAFIFQQHYLYSRNFTRLLCLVAGHLDKSIHRAAIVENLYEETGEKNINNRHSALMLAFLRRIGVNSTGDDVFRPFTKLYVERCINYIKEADAIEAAAFMAWGTEGIVPKLYQIFVDALKNIGFSEEDYHYFSLHIECDDGHHEALVNLMIDLMGVQATEFSEGALLERISSAIKKSLDLREEYFNAIYHELEIKPLVDMYGSIQSRYCRKYQTKLLNTHHSMVERNALYNNIDLADGIDFNVVRVPFNMESLDPRILTVLPGSSNESHKHAHETFFYVLSGKGRCYINEAIVAVDKGTMIHIPRWALHHTVNVGDDNLIILAVTDYGLTCRLAGNTEESYRKVPEVLGKAAVYVES